MNYIQNAKSSLESMPLSDKWSSLNSIAVSNTVLGGVWLLGSFFVGPSFFSGFGFQILFTAFVHLLYSLWLIRLIGMRDLRFHSLVVGIEIMMNVLLFETALLWSDFSNGMAIGLCVVESSRSDRFVSFVVTILFFSHLLMSGLAVLWQKDLLSELSYSPDQIPYVSRMSTTTDINEIKRKDSSTIVLDGGSYQQFSVNSSHSDVTGSPGNTDRSHFVIDDEDEAGL